VEFSGKTYGVLLAYRDLKPLEKRSKPLSRKSKSLSYSNSLSKPKKVLVSGTTSRTLFGL
jgi:hypothetical protein